MIPAVITRAANKAVFVTKANSPKILLVGGIIGVGATIVLASRASIKAQPVVQDAKAAKAVINELYQDRDPKDQERIKDLSYLYLQTGLDLAKLYSPVILVGTLSVTALIGSHNILSKRNAALTAAYSAIDKAFREYRERVAIAVGQDKERDIYYDVRPSDTTETIKDEDGKKLKIKEVGGLPSLYARFFDESNINWEKNPVQNLIFLRCQQNYANDLLKARGHVLLNDVYDMLGFQRTTAGAVVGWWFGNEEGDNFIDFGIYDYGNNGNAKALFLNGDERSILLDFNVDGVVSDRLGDKGWFHK